MKNTLIILGLLLGTSCAALNAEIEPIEAQNGYIILKHKGNEVGVGSGLSVVQRLEWLDNPDLIIGKVINPSLIQQNQTVKGLLVTSCCSDSMFCFSFC